MNQENNKMPTVGSKAWYMEMYARIEIVRAQTSLIHFECQVITLAPRHYMKLSFRFPDYCQMHAGQIAIYRKRLRRNLKAVFQIVK